MNLVKTYIDKSPIEGIGLFAGEFIKRGTLIWQLGGLDLTLSDSVFKTWCMSMTSEQEDYIKRYIYFNNGDWIYCCDDAKFTNHSISPNTIVNKYNQTAIKDIQLGEEITCNYYELDKDFSEDEFKQ